MMLAVSRYDGGEITLMVIAAVLLVLGLYLVLISLPYLDRWIGHDNLRYGAMCLILAVLFGLCGFIAARSHGETTTAERQLKQQGFHVYSVNVAREEVVIDQSGCKLTFLLKKHNGVYAAYQEMARGPAHRISSDIITRCVWAPHT